MIRQVPDRLTKREAECLHFIMAHTLNGKPCPTYQDIADAMGGISRGNVHKFISSLERMGYIDREAKQRRSIKVLKDSSGVLLNVPSEAIGATHGAQAVADGTNSAEQGM